MRRCSRMRKRRPIFAKKARHGKLAECGGVARARELCDSNRSLRVWLGIDSGSATTKLALVADDGEVIDSFYASNEGEPLATARDALIALRDRYASAGIQLRYGCVCWRGLATEKTCSRAHFRPIAIRSRRSPMRVPRARSFPMRASFSTLAVRIMKAMWVRRRHRARHRGEQRPARAAVGRFSRELRRNRSAFKRAILRRRHFEASIPRIWAAAAPCL